MDSGLQAVACYSKKIAKIGECTVKQSTYFGIFMGKLTAYEHIHASYYYILVACKVWVNLQKTRYVRLQLTYGSGWCEIYKNRGENMKIAAIICEYNPFHNGHKLQIEQTRAQGATHIVAVMSGNYVQRGEPAMWDKWTRTTAALQNGVDLVIELPLPYAVATAQKFASGAVAIIESLGCVDMLSFGSEQGDISDLKQVVEALRLSGLQPIIKEKLAAGVGYATARQQAVADLHGEQLADMLSQPNNILGIEYMSALALQNSKIMPVTIKRVGAGHDSQQLGEYASASALRGLIKSDEQACEKYLPATVFNLLIEQTELGNTPNTDLLERLMLSSLRSLTQQQLSCLPDMSEGLHNRLYRGIRQSTTMAELLGEVKTKRYSHARLRRIVLSAFLGIQAGSSAQPPPYIHFLGTNSKGKEILNLAGKTAKLPLSHSFATLQKLPNAKSFVDLECKADDLYGCFTNQIQPCGKSYQKFIVQK